MRVTALAARNIEDAGTGGQAEQLHESGRFLTIALGGKERPILEEIVGVERNLPPLF
jgi:hypothetical protein